MDVWNILSVGASTVVMFALIHVAVFYVVRQMYPPQPKPVVRFTEPVFIAPPPVPVQEVAPAPPEIPLVSTKLPPPIDTRDPGPARTSAPAFSEPVKDKEVLPPANVPTYESLLSAVSSSKEGIPNLGPMSGATV